MGYATVDDEVLEMALSGSVVDGDEVPECDLMGEGEVGEGAGEVGGGEGVLKG